MIIKLKKGETPYKKVREVIEETEVLIDDILVRMYLSYDYNNWHQVTALMTPMYDLNEWNYDWWEGEQYINLVGFIPLDEISDVYFMDKRLD